ncbi:retrovirus-related pol polyprotein from transposon TNT 1-94, partial [Tanacetum coccineum]
YRKTTYDVFRGRSPDISYFYMFGCPVHIHNHRDHLGKFNAKADDGFFLGYCPMAKALRVFKIRRQEMKDTYHVTFIEDDEAISKSSTEGNEINFNENRSVPDDEFLVPIPELTIADNNTGLNEHVDSESIEDLGFAEDQVPTILEPINNADPAPTSNSSLAELGLPPEAKSETLKQLQLMNAFMLICYIEIEPKKLIEALEEGWIIAMQEELNQFKRNKLDKALYGLKQALRAWYQANLKESHLVAVIRIFRYMKRTLNLGLWYPKGSGFDLKSYSDLDYAGCNLDRKSTSGGY